MYRHLLVPVDETEISAGNVTAAVAFARDAGARITFFHANADYGATADGALMHAMSPALFADGVAGHARAILAKAEAAARVAGVPCRAVCAVSDAPAQAILDGAKSEGCDLIFMASHGPASLGGIMLGSQMFKVVAGAPIPVLVSSVWRSAEHRARDAALAIINDEHRSIAALLHALRSVVARATDEHALLDTHLLRAAIHYLRTFPEVLHHPKEEQYIFRRLRQRSPELGAVLDDLERQHARGGDAARRGDRRRGRLRARAGCAGAAPGCAGALHGRAMGTHGNRGAPGAACGARAARGQRMGRDR